MMPEPFPAAHCPKCGDTGRVTRTRWSSDALQTITEEIACQACGGFFFPTMREDGTMSVWSLAEERWLSFYRWLVATGQLAP